MHGYVTSIDSDWYETVRSGSALDEVDVWRPGTQHHFRAIEPGEPVFLRLKAPVDRIAGFGFFSHFSILPVSVAWRIFGTANGEASFGAMRERVIHLRRQHDMELDPRSDLEVGCILLQMTSLFAEKHWVDPPADLDDHAGHGKRYDLSNGEGRRLWLECVERLSDLEGKELDPKSITPTSRYGPLSFRVAVLDAWDRRCAVTGEGVAVALGTAVIRPEMSGWRSLSNAILMRADLALLFEAGYLTISPDHRLMVSSSVPSSEAQRDYGRLHGTGIRLPSSPAARPDPELLWWHQNERFLG